MQLDRSVHLGVGRAVHAQGLTASWVSGNGKVEPRRQLYSQDRQRLGYPGSATPALFNSRRTMAVTFSSNWAGENLWA